ncbi:MGH1-like glycoside hydrolase domain-containing protein [Fundidesulfovibrio agrisoli]|uniref:MGH1-like glycoside hydrolase domain-containing protein n=1 Tax=Fundidesulfovibrio agrisoli TaxID=2922717 RepID=UPI001FADB4AB|nr:glucosidase [Fundidesulfovibrio agrisoli]
MTTEEKRRLSEARDEGVPWRKWGPYLSERQWGTVREDYSQDGDAWNHFSHDQARSRAYQWGEDGLAGISDSHQVLCFALALWNGCDPILKERLFGLTNSEGNHGEDVKEYYFYLDSTPTHSYMKYLYKYPQQAFPYEDLVRTNAGRTRLEPEYELLDTGVFNEDRYFDVFVEYAKASPQDILIRVTVCNRGPEAAVLDVLPTLWFRNTWSWPEGGSRPELRAVDRGHGKEILARHTDPLFLESLPEFALCCEAEPELLFTENDTNRVRLYGQPNESPYVKDGIHRSVVQGERDAVNPDLTGTKASARYRVLVEPGAGAVIRVRLRPSGEAGVGGAAGEPFGHDFDDLFALREGEADEYYADQTPKNAGEDEARVLRQALAGMFWSKQYYYFDADKWLDEHKAHPLHRQERASRNREWFHMVNDHVISMPDKWEYPWYAAWDLAFHTVAMSSADPDFAKEQLELMLRESYMHPSGQLPAYEWNFSDVNPPVHAWAALFLYLTEKSRDGKGDTEFLRRCFSKLTLNFTWWVNRKDRFGKNVFEGGFLGLDNIGVFDRSASLPTGGHLEQADGTAWMAFFCQNMIEICAELVEEDPFYEDLCTKFLEHFLWIASAVNQGGGEGMWDEEDGFYYDILRLPDGSAQRLKVRSMVGLLPLCAVTVIEPWQRERMPRAASSVVRLMRRMPELLESIHLTGPGHYGHGGRGIIALVNEQRLRRILTCMLDEEEFLSPYGIRALSRHHQDHPYVFRANGDEYRVGYLPAESDSGMFGGNSNWRGPVWMPVNILLVRALLNYYTYYGDTFTIECPTGSGNMMNLFEVAREIASRLTRIFLRGEDSRRPVFGGAEKFQADPHWRDNILFYEYFHGDNGAGIGANHQTGWTGLVAKLIEIFGLIDAETYLERGKHSAFRKGSDAGA